MAILETKLGLALVLHALSLGLQWRDLGMILNVALWQESTLKQCMRRVGIAKVVNFLGFRVSGSLVQGRPKGKGTTTARLRAIIRSSFS